MPEGTPHRLRRALARAEAGKTLALDEAEALMQARGPDLERLMELAARLRDLGHGDVVTYSRKVFIPLTMLCRDHCHYCTFAKPPAKLDAPFLTPEQAVAIAERRARDGLQGGALHARGPPGGPLPGRPRVARGARLRVRRSTTSAPWPSA